MVEATGTDAEKDRCPSPRCWWPSENTQLWLQPALVVTLAVTMLRGFLVPSHIHISPKRKGRWLTVALGFAPLLTSPRGSSLTHQVP